MPNPKETPEKEVKEEVEVEETTEDQPVEKEVKEVKEPAKEEVVEETVEDPASAITGTKSIDLSGNVTYEDLLAMPTALSSGVKSLRQAIEKPDFQEDGDSAAAIGLAIYGDAHAASSGMLEEIAQKPGLVTELEIEGGDPIGLRERVVKSTKGRKLKSKSVKAMAYSFLGVGGIVQVPLWHSGFNVTLGTISSADRVALNLKLADAMSGLGANTAGLIFSNDTVVLSRIITDFIVENIVETSLKLDDSDDIRKYIKVQDMMTLALLLIKAISPKGFNIALSCHNAIEVNEDGTDVLCNYAISGKVNTDLLLHVNKDAINSVAKGIIGKRTKNSVTVDDISTYVDEIAELSEGTYRYEVNGRDVEITFHSPNVETYFAAGEKWITYIEDEADDLVTTSDEINKEVKLLQITRVTMLNVYAHFVKSIRMGDDTFDTPEEIAEVLSAFTARPDVTDDIYRDMKDYVNTSVVSVVGTPSYTCPKCRKEVKDTEAIRPFSSVIPLNVISIFFDLSNLNMTTLDKALST